MSSFRCNPLQLKQTAFGLELHQGFAALVTHEAGLHLQDDGLTRSSREQ